VVDCSVAEGDNSSLDILEPRSGKRILAWRVSARFIVTGCSSPERAADTLSLSVALSGLAVLVLVFPGLTTPLAKDLALLRSARLRRSPMFMVIREESCELRRSGIKVTKSDAAPPELITLSIRYYKH
jgi:hypothetical protein